MVCTEWFDTKYRNMKQNVRRAFKYNAENPKDNPFYISEDLKEGGSEEGFWDRKLNPVWYAFEENSARKTLTINDIVRALRQCPTHLNRDRFWKRDRMAFISVLLQSVLDQAKLPQGSTRKQILDVLQDSVFKGDGNESDNDRASLFIANFMMSYQLATYYKDKPPAEAVCMFLSDALRCMKDSWLQQGAAIFTDAFRKPFFEVLPFTAHGPNAVRHYDWGFPLVLKRAERHALTFQVVKGMYGTPIDPEIESLSTRVRKAETVEEKREVVRAWVKSGKTSQETSEPGQSASSTQKIAKVDGEKEIKPPSSWVKKVNEEKQSAKQSGGLDLSE